MHAYLPKSFQRDVKQQGVSDEDCKEAIRKAESGLVDADLGGGLIKQRIPRDNLSAARGSRAIIFYRRGQVAVFLHLFSKSAKANLAKKELAEYLKLAQSLEKLSDEKLRQLSVTKGWKKLEL